MGNNAGHEIAVSARQEGFYFGIVLTVFLLWVFDKLTWTGC